MHAFTQMHTHHIHEIMYTYKHLILTEKDCLPLRQSQYGKSYERPLLSSKFADQGC